MNKPTIYLCGPMSGLTWREALEWRDEATAALSYKWRLINPCRAEVLLDSLDDLIVSSTQDDKDLDLTCTATGICAQDEFFIDQSDWLLCNFLKATQISFGSGWEMGYAWAKGKKILSIIEPGSLHDQAFPRRRSHLFTPNFEEAIDFFHAIAL